MRCFAALVIGLSLLALDALYQCPAVCAQEKPAALKEWEFKAVLIGINERDATRKLNDLASEGWQYVGPLGNGVVAFRRPADPFQPKTNWVGEFTRQVAGDAPSKGASRFELTVLSRDGQKFTARVRLAENVVFVAKGTIEDGKIEWRGKDTKLEKATPSPHGPRHDYSGQLKSNRLLFSYSGVVAADGKTPVSGTAVADLVKSARRTGMWSRKSRGRIPDGN